MAKTTDGMCRCCGFEGRVYKVNFSEIERDYYESNPYLCEICDNTNAPYALKESHRIGLLIVSIAWILLKEIRKNRRNHNGR